MGKLRSRRLAPLSSRLSGGGNGSFSVEERKLLPQLLELLRSGALASLLPAGSQVTQPIPQQSEKQPKHRSSATPAQETSAPATREAGWSPVKVSKMPSAELKDKLVANGWSVPIKQSPSDMRSSEPGICLVSTSDGRKLVKELKGDHPLAILVPTNITNTGEEVHVLVEDPTGRWQTRRRFMIQLGIGCVSYMEGKPKKSFRADSVKVVLSLAKRHTNAETWGHAVKNAQELTKQWLKLRAQVEFLDVRPPTRIAGANDGLQVVVFVPASAWIQILRASGLDGIFVRQFMETDQDRSVYRAVPMPVEATLGTSLGQAKFLADKAFGVVPYGSGFGIRVKSCDFEEILALLQPDKRHQFSGKTCEISGLPLAMGKESLQEFFGDWKLHPLHTFRQGFRRTWIVRATEQPTETTVYHEFGLAVIKEAAPRRSNASTERFHAPRAERSAPFIRERESNYPKAWAGIAKGSTPSNDGGPTRFGKDGTISASVASTIPTAVPGARAPVTASQMHVDTPVPAHIPVEARTDLNPAGIHPSVNPTDLAKIMAAAIEAALQPMKERLEATIMPMQRTLESLQAEFIALRAEEKDEAMTSRAAADAKRLRLGADV